MRYLPDDKVLVRALATVKKYDSATYARMDSDKQWVVTSDMSALPPVVQNDLLGTTAFGTTYPVGNVGADIAVTFLNTEYIDEWADHYSVDRNYFAAAVLVHEYRHAHQTTRDARKAEPPAFAAGSAFAAKLPNPSGAMIKALSDETEKDFA